MKYIDIPGSDTIIRLKHSVFVRILYYPIAVSIRRWRNCFYRYSRDARYIASLKDCYKGKRCFVIGNGPSLIPKDLDRIKNEHSFAVNRIYELFDKTEWRPEFYMVHDPDLIRKDISKITRIDAKHIFANITARKYMRIWGGNITFIYCYKRFRMNSFATQDISFSTEPYIHFGTGPTVLHLVLQLAIFMGFSEIYLLGADNSYRYTMDSRGKVIDTKQNRSHFYDEASASDGVPTFGCFEWANNCYMLAKAYADAHGIKIYNATRGGKLEVFDRVDFDSLF